MRNRSVLGGVGALLLAGAMAAPTFLRGTEESGTGATATAAPLPETREAKNAHFWANRNIEKWPDARRSALKDCIQEGGVATCYMPDYKPLCSVSARDGEARTFIAATFSSSDAARITIDGVSGAFDLTKQGGIVNACNTYRQRLGLSSHPFLTIEPDPAQP